MIDLKSELGARVAKRLHQESTIWLTTTGADGMPQPRPVWFLWDEGSNTVIIFTQPSGAKVRHIEKNPKVALNLNTNPHGGDVVVLLGQAEVLHGTLPPELIKAYVDKYRVGMKNIGMNPEQFEQSYSTVVRVTPTKMRAF
ncbi:MAG: TIGR03667 family PPOX class F420-dependent oxidoreductase [Anaerolineae bacterium]